MKGNTGGSKASLVLNLYTRYRWEVLLAVITLSLWTVPILLYWAAKPVWFQRRDRLRTCCLCQPLRWLDYCQACYTQKLYMMLY